jgi:flagellar assembly protein FliH
LEEFVRQAESVTSKGAAARIEVFNYLACPDAPSLPEWTGWADAEAAEEGESKSGATTDRDAGEETIERELRAEFEARLGEEKCRAFEAGCEQGRRTEREAQSGPQAAVQQQRAQQAIELIESFTQERDRYMGAVEHEVVKLALAVAARILRREAQMDPLLLTGAVRVALGQLAGSTKARLRVPEAELDLWREAIALVPNLAVRPAVSAGDGMRLGDCVIETELGSVDLGIRAQLGEIERGFFDRAGSVSSSKPRSDTAELAAAAGTTGEEGGV